NSPNYPAFLLRWTSWNGEFVLFLIRHAFCCDSVDNGLKRNEPNSPGGAEPPAQVVNLRKRMSLASESSRAVRTRGRPELLGDELDSELLDQPVKVKRLLRRGHLSVSKALDLYREFIQQRPLGLPVEFRGDLTLHLSWASVLVRRIAERESNGLDDLCGESKFPFIAIETSSCFTNIKTEPINCEFANG
ncbi:Uncharacterized protein C05D10.1, partial [Toxocara canis]